MSLAWPQISGNLETVQEGKPVSIDLLVPRDSNVSVLAGHLPPGLKVKGTKILGTPAEVSSTQSFKFVLRATSNSSFEDKTFSIIVEGPDEPVWKTEEGLLPVGKGGTFFILDSALIDFQLEAVDPDIQAGQELKYFIASGGGELPPGIELTSDGRLRGIVDPLLSLEKQAGDGGYDEYKYDRNPFDFGIREGGLYDSFYFDTAQQEEEQEQAVARDLGFSGVNYDTFFYDKPILEEEEEDRRASDLGLGYDTIPYDFATRSRTPKKLNRFFEFVVSVSDGQTISKRNFKIYVVGDDFLRADNAIMKVANGVFTADVTYLRTPVWITPGDLGVRRANNLVTIFLDVIDNNTVPGSLFYQLETENPDGSSSTLPPGTEIDPIRGEIFGRVPYQPSVTETYKFTITARRLESNQGVVELQQFATESVPAGLGVVPINKLENLSDKVLGRTFPLGNKSYKVVDIATGSDDSDLLILNEVLEEDLEKGASINLGQVSVIETEIANAKKTFNITLLGEVDSIITWNTPSNLAEVSANYQSILMLNAETTVPRGFIVYTLESGNLPPGLRLSLSGEIIGRIDKSEINSSKKYTFRVQAQDQFRYSAETKEFSIFVNKTDNLNYADLYLKPFFRQDLKNIFRTLISNLDTFIPDNIYRLDDPNFGIKNDPKILLYGGLEDSQAENYVAGTAFFRRRTLIITGVKRAVAKLPGTNTEVYEVIYLELQDQAGNTTFNNPRNLKSTSNYKITADITDDLGNIEGSNSIFIETRNKRRYRINFGGAITVGLRNQTDNWLINTNDRQIDLRNEESSVHITTAETTNLGIRPANPNPIKVDSAAQKVSDINTSEIFVSSIGKLRETLRSSVNKVERNFLPLWMRTAQEETLQEPGFTLALPLVYTNPGKAQILLDNIRNLDIDLTRFHIDIDRLLVERSNQDDLSIVFPNRENVI